MERIELKNINEVIYHEVIDNGLNVYIYSTPYVNNYELDLMVKVGSKVNHYTMDGKEIKIPNGVEHYLEHLTLNTPDGDADEFYSNNGSYCNAFTSFDRTWYQVNAQEHLEDNLRYLINYVDSPFYNEELVEKERGIITEEVSMYENDPYQKVYYSHLSNIFFNDNKRNRIGGTVNDVKSITLDDITNTYNAFYKKDNMTLIVVGNVDPEEIIRIVKDNEKDKEKTTLNVEVLVDNEPDEVVKEYEEVYDNVLIPKISLGIKIPKNKLDIEEDTSFKYFYLLTDILFGETSELRLKLEQENLISDSLDTDMEICNDHYLLMIMFESEHADKVLDLIMDTLNNIVITDRDIDIKKRVLISSLIRRYENISAVASNINYYLTLFGHILTNEYEIIEDITLNEIVNILDVIKNSSKSIIKLLPKE